MPASWLIGSDPECDLVVDSPTVSRRHCRLDSDADGFSLEDLGSSNGTYINGQRIPIATRVRVSPSDAITLGLNVPLPWPADSPSASARSSAQQGGAPLPVLTLRGEAMVIGRDPDCHLALDVPVVSGRHARVSRSGDLVLLEDLGSSNGTFLNGRRIDRAVSVRPGDLVGLGSYALIFAEESPAHAARATAVIDPGPVYPVTRVETGAPPVARALPHPWLLLALVGQVLPLSVAIAMLRGSDAVVLFWLGLAAVWFGLSSAVLTSTSGIDPWRSGGVGSLVPRIGVLAVLCVLQCVLAWVIVSTMAHLQGAAVPQVALLALASGVGLALGMVVVLLIRSPAATWLLLAPILLTLWTLGGEHWPVTTMASWTRLLANATPTRWAFEGLLLLEADAGGSAAETGGRSTPRSTTSRPPPTGWGPGPMRWP